MRRFYVKYILKYIYVIELLVLTKSYNQPSDNSKDQ